jgi:hypothetical protein
MTKIETNVVKPEIKFFENEVENLVISSNYESTLDTKISGIESFMSNNNGKGKSDSEKDELYKQSQILWRDYALNLKNTRYNFHLNRAQYKFLTDLILTKLEYDVNTVFFAIELTDMLASMKKIEFSNDKDLVLFEVNATEITYIYHLISKHKVKGLTKDAYTFTQILQRIGNISKIFNYYDTAGKTLSTDIQDWISSLEDGVSVEGKTEVIEANVAKPKKSKV